MKIVLDCTIGPHVLREQIKSWNFLSSLATPLHSFKALPKRFFVIDLLQIMCSGYSGYDVPLS